jgi:hypothetical protein
VEVSVSAGQPAAVLAGVVLAASIVSVELGVTVALVELTLGVLAGNTLDMHSQAWLDFIASFASIVLTFLAGMEVDPAYLRRRLGPVARDRRGLIRRHHRLPLRPYLRDHRRDAVLAARHSGRRLRGRPHGDRGAALPAERERRIDRRLAYLESEEYV